MPPSSAHRAATYKLRQNARGLVQLALWVPAAAVPELKLQAELMLAHRHLTVGPLRDPVSGRLVALRERGE